MNAGSIFESISQGILICDMQGRIQYFNPAYSTLVGDSLAHLKGRHIRSIRKGTYVPRVIRTREAVENVFREENGIHYYANIYPLVYRGRMQGTISIVTMFFDASKRVENDTRTLKERVEEFEREEIRKELLLTGESKEGKKEAAEKLGISVATMYRKLESENDRAMKKAKKLYAEMHPV